MFKQFLIPVSLLAIAFGYLSCNKEKETFSLPNQASPTIAPILKEQTYTINISSENGTVGTDKRFCGAGDIVHLTLIPNEGCKFFQLVVKDALNRPIEVSNDAFIMPESKVQITATFVNDLDGLGTSDVPYILPSNATDIISPIAEGDGERITYYKMIANCDSVMSISCDTLRKEEKLSRVDRHRNNPGGGSSGTSLENGRGMKSCDLFVINQDVVTFTIISPDASFATNRFKISYREKEEGESFDKPITLSEGATGVPVVSPLLDRWYMVYIPTNTTLDLNIFLYEKYIKVYALEDGISHKLENRNLLPLSMKQSTYTYTNTNDTQRNVYINIPNTIKGLDINVAFTKPSETTLVKQ